MSWYSAAFIGGRGFSSNYGGVENATREICLELSLKDTEIFIYGLSSEPSVTRKNIKLITCPSYLYEYFGHHIMILYCVLHTVFILRPKVVFLFASGPCIFTPLIRLTGIKVVSSLRAVDSARDK